MHNLGTGRSTPSIQPIAGNRNVIQPQNATPNADDDTVRLTSETQVASGRRISYCCAGCIGLTLSSNENFQPISFTALSVLSSNSST